MCDRTDKIMEYMDEIEYHVDNIALMARNGTLPKTIDEDKVEMWRQRKLNEILVKSKEY
jgi:hypothetical protein